MLEEELTDTEYLGVIKFISFSKNEEEILVFRKDIDVICVTVWLLYILILFLVKYKLFPCPPFLLARKEGESKL